MRMPHVQLWLIWAVVLLLCVGGSATPVHAKRVVLPQDIQLEDIQNALDLGIDAMLKNEPLYTFPPEHAFHGGYAGPQEIRNMMGNHALACWALLAAGESYQNPKLYRRINWVLSGDAPWTYDRGMRMSMLGLLPRDRWKPWSRRDFLWLTSAVTDGGNFDEKWTGQPLKGPGDNANGQYGVLGMWGCDRAGFPADTKVWQKIDDYWRKAQQKTSDNEPAGWAVYTFDNQKDATAGTRNIEFYKRVSGPMTAGGVMALSLAERVLYGARMAELDDKTRAQRPQLGKGVDWLDQNFHANDKAEETDRYFYLWTIQRVGRITGYATFNKTDWFREVTAAMINEQSPDGVWRGDKGTLISSGFALLYLGQAYDPIAIGKLRLAKGAWNNRPHDLWNLTDYMSNAYEVSTTWQIFEADQPAWQLIEAPIVYLTTDTGFEFNANQVKNLREYVNAGGLLVINPDKVSGDTLKSTQKLAEQMFPEPDLKLTKVESLEHPFYNIHQPIKQPWPMQIVHNGVRPMFVYIGRDAGSGLQENDPLGKGSESFRLMSNIYLYVTGLNPRRARLRNNAVALLEKANLIPVDCARLKHSGKFDPEPGSLNQLRALLARDCNVDLRVTTINAKELSGHKIAFLTTMGDGTMNEEDSAQLKRWLQAGGTLVMDATSGSAAAAQAARDMLTKVVPGGDPAPLPLDHPVLSGQNLGIGSANNRWVRYRNFALKSMGPVNSPKLRGVDVDGRFAVLFSTEDITCGMAGLEHWNIFGYTTEYARRIAVNAVLSVIKNPAPKP